MKASYGTQIKRDFGAEPYQWNFAKDPQKAKNVVNAKVAKTSNGALKRFLEPGTKSVFSIIENHYLIHDLINST